MPAAEYTNPVYPGYFADPFVWKHEDAWYAVGTGALEARSEASHGSDTLTINGKPGVFSILRSTDFANWQLLGSALESLPPEFGDAYWAPEVAYEDGRFFLYYSVGYGDKAHHIRVAVSDRPEGPYYDTGNQITNPYSCPFAIDASPFRDDDGQWYLFYARDFIDFDDRVRAGTAVVVDRLDGMNQLAGEERVVARATFDWQRFLSGRVMYGNVYDWHTIEGPAVRKRNGKYYCLFSAGRWENESYGVDFVVADSVMGPYSAEGMSERGARVLRTVPGSVIGPGHNSISVGPDGSTDYIVYHAWDPYMTARRMFIDKLTWTPQGPVCAGPTHQPQPLP